MTNKKKKRKEGSKIYLEHEFWNKEVNGQEIDNFTQQIENKLREKKLSLVLLSKNINLAEQYY